MLNALSVLTMIFRIMAYSSGRPACLRKHSQGLFIIRHSSPDGGKPALEALGPGKVFLEGLSKGLPRLHGRLAFLEESVVLLSQGHANEVQRLGISRAVRRGHHTVLSGRGLLLAQLDQVLGAQPALCLHRPYIVVDLTKLGDAALDSGIVHLASSAPSLLRLFKGFRR